MNDKDKLIDAIKWHLEGVKAFQQNNINGQWDIEIQEFLEDIKALKKKLNY